MSERTATRLRRPRPEVKDAIIDAVERLLGRFGYAKMTIEDVAREAGIGKGTVYLHFSNKEDLVLSSIDRIVERLLTRMQAVALGSLPPPDKIRRALAIRVMDRFDNIHQDAPSLDAMLAVIRSALLARREGYFDSEAAILSRILAEGNSLGSFAVPDPDQAARTLITATNALLPYSLSKKELGRRALVEGQVRRLADLLVTGLAAGPTLRQPDRGHSA